MEEEKKQLSRKRKTNAFNTKFVWFNNRTSNALSYKGRNSLSVKLAGVAYV